MLFRSPLPRGPLLPSRCHSSHSTCRPWPAPTEPKRSIGRGDVDVAEVIRDCPWETESMTLAELLTSQRRWGRTRARKLLQAVALSENKRLGTLTPRQRALLSSTLAFN